MTEPNLDHYRARLIALKDEILEQGNIEIEPNNRDDFQRPDADDDQPLNEMNQIIASKRNVERTLLLERVQKALYRIKTEPDDYGYCLACDDPIPKRRLDLMPYAELCIECKEKTEESTRTGHRRRLTDV